MDNFMEKTEIMICFCMNCCLSAYASHVLKHSCFPFSAVLLPILVRLDRLQTLLLKRSDLLHGKKKRV